MKNIYLALRQRIEEATTIQYVRLFNNQFDHLEAGESIIFPFPCVFIEFIGDINYMQMGKGFQNAGDCLVRLYIGNNFYNGDEQNENLEIFDLKDEVFLALQGYSNASISGIVRTTERTDVNHTNIYIFQQEYRVSFTDKIAEYPRNKVTVNPPVKLSVTSYMKP